MRWLPVYRAVGLHRPVLTPVGLNSWAIQMRLLAYLAKSSAIGCVIVRNPVDLISQSGTA